MSSIYLPGRIKFGEGLSKNIGREFHDLGCKNIMIVCDEGIVSSGILNTITQYLDEEAVAFAVFDHVIPDPDVQCIYQARDFYIEEQCDGILAIGGGSSIDTAKGAGLSVTNTEPVMNYAGVDNIHHLLPPLVAIPTTCGTGSEVTNVTVITDEHHVKYPFVSDHLMPTVALLDPELLYSLPSHLVASTGMDALTHAVEALTNKNDNWLADACAIKAIRMIGEHIKQATISKDKDSLSEMLYASSLAGIAFSLSRLGLVHAMSHPVSGIANVPHGLANAVLLPYILNFNLVGEPEKHALFSREFGVAYQGNAIDTAQAGVEAVIKMNEQLGIPKSFQELDVDKGLIPQMVEDTFKSGNIQINAREVNQTDVEKIYVVAFTGEFHYYSTQ
ncbi:iron-containing alcohol dehydrogenase [Salicibibacter cibi]|uniref:Iron-containing alcohol dehydrogenase n=1 Tax=Salicibibacter cibi TaxID=2743001 RepID=A0A7T6Z8M7_9BACI|nr:iron-containing alcohol dehydrogenase [Salicibibacter cibi]QQK78850.1 iron-containing alcohol dehydrogenase [Salicibibacter cibi]